MFQKERPYGRVSEMMTTKIREAAYRMILPVLFSAAVFLCAAAVSSSGIPGKAEPQPEIPVILEKELEREYISSFEPDIVSSYDPLRPSYMGGNCGKAEGTYTAVVLFADDDVSSWTEEEAEDVFLSQIVPGLRWIENEASGYGVYLSFETVSFVGDGHGLPVRYGGTVNPDYRNSGTEYDILDSIAKGRGLGSGWELYALMSMRYGRDDVVFIVVFNKQGVGRTIALSGGTGEGMAEHSVLFADRDPGSGAVAAAHETLHLFGAEDLYEGSERPSMAREYYPDDIMLVNPGDPEMCRTGDYTAFTVGWTDTVPEVCRYDGWYR